MTTRRVECVAEEALGDLLELPDSDPRRAHLETCPRCRALVSSYRQFLEPTREEAAAYGTGEDERLTAVRERLGGLPSPPVGAGSASGGPARGGAAQKDARARGWFAPVLRPVWALAALLVVAGGVWLAPRLAAPPDHGVLRGAAPPALTIEAAVPRPDGTVHFAWQQHPGADHYEIRFYSTSLTEIGRRDLGAAHEADLAAADLPQAYHAGELVLYRIVAMKGGDEIETSAPGSLQRP